LSRWVTSGHLVQLRRGLYALAPPYRKAEPHPFLVANHLVRGSYVSLQSALAHHGLIPEHVPVTTSLTTGRPQHRENAFGSFEYRHCPPERLTGYRTERLGGGQEALVATPAKALADLIHLVPGADSRAYLAELRARGGHTASRGSGHGDHGRSPARADAHPALRSRVAPGWEAARDPAPAVAAVRARLRSVRWDVLAADVRPLLESPEDRALLTWETITSLLDQRAGQARGSA
jgi:hypothetical protein